MNRRFLSLVFSAVILLCGGVQPALADWYYVDVSDCSITSIGNRQWQVAFNTESYSRGTGTNAVNYFTIKIPSISGNTMNRNVFVWDPTPITNLTMPPGVAIRAMPTSPTTGILIGPPGNGALIIPSDGSANGRITFTFATTVANNAYPAVRIETTATSTSGGEGAWGDYWILPNSPVGSCSYENPPPVSELFPVDPEFTLKATEWVLATADVGNLPDVTAAGTGYPATINNINNNNLCVRYVTAGVTNKQYALAVTNNVSVQGGRNLFTLLGPDSSQLFYNLQLSSNDSNTANNFNFPASGSTSYITLGQTNNYSADHSEMCWTPRINLFKNATTKEGIHSGTLNFIITPKA